jgi:hypothetical protein
MQNFERLAGWSAFTAAVGGILYGLFFVVIGNIGIASALLMVGGLLSSVVLVAFATSLRSVNEQAARWALALGFIAAIVSVLHGGYDLANVIHPPLNDILSQAEYPNAIDPRGVGTFGLAGLSYLVLSTVAVSSPRYPKRLARLGQALGIVMIVIYAGRLVILDPTHPVVRTALALGVVANTVFFLWLGMLWTRSNRQT